MKLIAFFIFIVAASLAAGATFIDSSSHIVSGSQATTISPHTAFEYTLVLDDSEIEWFSCSWAEFRCD